MLSITLLLVVILLALIGAHLADRWQKRQRRSQLRRKRLRIQLQDLEEILICLEDTLPERDVARRVNQEVMTLLEEIRLYERNSPEPWEARLRQAQAREAEWDTPQALNRLRESDSQIARAQQGLQKAGELLRRQHTRGQLEREALDLYLKQLSWAQLMISVISFVAQGHKAIRRGDYSVGQSFYKKAQSLLVGHAHPDPQRSQMIQELSQIILGERKALSPELMPEIGYNPA
ncbi:hypothetical protein [Marinimicrobium sp. ABcell2]|uniref:hypothetical protein n=1 Tax=Marinimicrobium sp. ABcell2 TaxID=3069751 RepID=UPI0027B1027E|nr:hypothetical protein [Marinimicrobium sp. ABcell2]MDQ2075576.1 hypothetical protein [Marinimicrobium sp. ABcell2]